MIIRKTHYPGKNHEILVYSISTLFMVFFSVNAIQKWPDFWAQTFITLACILPAFFILVKKPPLIQDKDSPIIINLTLAIVILGMLNILYSEDRIASLKGMTLFLMSGTLVFITTYNLFTSRQAQKQFIYLCTFCFFIFLGHGIFELTQDFNSFGNEILLSLANPISAGSIIILVSAGPFIFLAQAKNKRIKFFWVFCLLANGTLIILTAQRSTILAILIILVFLAGKNLKLRWVFVVSVLTIISIGLQFKEKIPLQYKNKLLNNQTVLIRMEFYHIALDVFKEKPLFGLGLNSSLERFTPPDYTPKYFSLNSEPSFNEVIAGLKVFDNIFLSSIGEAGGLFTISYIGLIAYLSRKIFLASKLDSDIALQNYFLFLILIGFMVQSMAFDSLKNPALNWMFHSILGFAANRRDL